MNTISVLRPLCTEVTTTGESALPIVNGHGKAAWVPECHPMNWVTYDTIYSKMKGSPYALLSRDEYQGFRLLNKPLVFSNDMPCGSYSNEVAILYGDFRQVEVLQQGNEPMQEHECIAFPGSVEVSMDAVHYFSKNDGKGRPIMMT